MLLSNSILLGFPLSYAFNGSFSVGVAPILGYLSIRTNASQQSPWMPNDGALGGGVRVGARYEINQPISIGGALQSPIKFQKLKQYADLFKNSTQLPMIALIGTAWHVTSTTDILFDFEEIFWASTSSSGQLPTIPGGAGWRNAYDIKVGAQQQLNEIIVLRAGYQYGPVVIPEQYVFPYNVFNVPAALTEHLVTGGVGYQPFGKSFSIDLTTIYGIPKSLIDNGMGPLGAAAQGYTIKGSYVAALIGFNWKYC
jgi:long-subunit fatty acid transport protein